MPLSFTPLMKQRLTRRTQSMLERSLLRFPELNGKIITVGYTRANLGSASLSYRTSREPRLIIRLKVRKLTYQTIGHELTHLIQGLAQRRAGMILSGGDNRIPSGEKSCDIWTLARDRLFCDDSPSYLRMPRSIRDNWPVYAGEVRKLCVAAIEKRKTHRHYIRWLEAQIRQLARPTAATKNIGRQLTLPFES
jgi:hypothetical protein